MELLALLAGQTTLHLIPDTDFDSYMMVSDDNTIGISIHHGHISVIIFVEDDQTSKHLATTSEIEESCTWDLANPDSLTEVERMIKRFIKKRKNG